uniref:Uncharacterized protein n=1 Tax=Micrurus corallinus TaxID=54390 RepID=A0A2D4F1Z1_MICCO
MVGLSRLRGGGLLLVLALLPLALDGKPLEEAPTAPSRIIPFSRPVRKESRAVLDPMVHPGRPARSGDDGDLSRLEGLDTEALVDGCFGLKLVRVGVSSGLGCNPPTVSSSHRARRPCQKGAAGRLESDGEP